MAEEGEDYFGNIFVDFEYNQSSEFNLTNLDTNLELLCLHENLNHLVSLNIKEM